MNTKIKATLITLTSFLGVIFADAFGDKIKFHWQSFVFNNWNAKFFGPDSWENKWEKNEDGTLKKDENGNLIRVKWNIFGLKITKPVIFTDGWHLIKAFKLLLIFVPYAVMAGMLGILTWCYNLAILIVLWSILFEWLFADILEKK